MALSMAGGHTLLCDGSRGYIVHDASLQQDDEAGEAHSMFGCQLAMPVEVQAPSSGNSKPSRM